MEVEQIRVTKAKAQSELAALKEAVQQNAKLAKEQIYLDLHKVYGHMQHGGKVLDVIESFKKAGLSKKGYPKIAICKADSKLVFLSPSRNGSAIFYHDRGGATRLSWAWRGDKNDVSLPEGTFKWPENMDYSFYKYQQTIVPIIPPKILKFVKHKLSNYHLLWEVTEWKPVPPKDPILLRKLTPNLYAILATWNLTPLERAIIRGRIA